MSFFSSIGDFFGDAVSSVTSGISSAWDFLKDGSLALGDAIGITPKSLASSAVDFGAKYLENSYIQQGNAQQAFENSQLATAEQFERAKELARIQNTYNVGNYRTRYQRTMQDMAKAGLNPIMAASGGFSVGNAPSVSLPSVSSAQSYQAHNPTVSGLQLAQTEKTTAEAENVQADTQNKIKQLLVQQAQANELVTRQYLMRAQARQASQSELKLIQETRNLEQQHAKMANEILQISSQTDLAEEQQAQVKQMTEKLRLETQNIKAQYDKLHQISKVYDGPLGNKIAYLKEILGIISLGLIQ
jgi:DNA anti-recombination protein RmuC